MTWRNAPFQNTIKIVLRAIQLPLCQNIDVELTEVANNHLKKMENIFFEQLKASQATGELTTKTDARLLSLSLINLWNGLNITRKIYTSKKDLKALVDFQLAVLV